MSLLLLIILMVAVEWSTESSRNFGLNGARLTFAVFHVSQTLSNLMVFESTVIIAMVRTIKYWRVLFFSMKNPPYDVFVHRPDGNHTYMGSGPIWHSWLAKKLNFTYVFTDYSHSVSSFLLFVIVPVGFLTDTLFLTKQ